MADVPAVPACVHFRYDATFAELKENLREKDKEISELKISISEMEARKNREVQRLGDVEASYQVSSSPIKDVQSAHTCRNRTLNIHLLIAPVNGKSHTSWACSRCAWCWYRWVADQAP
jgi:hypothetical protein